LGPEHPSTLISVSVLASLLSSKGDYPQAAPLFRRALEGFMKASIAIQRDHPNLNTAVAQYTGVLQQMGYSRDELSVQINAVGRPFGFRFGS